MKEFEFHRASLREIYNSESSSLLIALIEDYSDFIQKTKIQMPIHEFVKYWNCIPPIVFNEMPQGTTIYVIDSVSCTEYITIDIPYYNDDCDGAIVSATVSATSLINGVQQGEEIILMGNAYFKPCRYTFDINSYLLSQGGNNKCLKPLLITKTKMQQN